MSQWQFWARFCIHRKISVLNICLLMLRKQIIAHPSPSKSFQLRMMTLRNSFLLLLLTWIFANSGWQKEGRDWYSASPSWNPRHYSKSSSIHGNKYSEVDRNWLCFLWPMLSNSIQGFYSRVLWRTSEEMHEFSVWFQHFFRTLWSNCCNRMQESCNVLTRFQF